jgi:HSP20 family protein
MALIRWKPFSEFDEFFELFHHNHHGSDLAIDMFENEKTITLKMNLAGIDPDKVEISVEGHHVRIKGNREEEKEIHNTHYYKKEIRRGSFERLIELPCPVLENSARAESANGMLTITFEKPNAKEISGKKINIMKK